MDHGQQTTIESALCGLLSVVSGLSILLLMDIKEARYIISSPSVDQCPPPDKPEYAFIGRSNVGKSSLINMLTNNSKLAKTSGTPGKTQLLNYFMVHSDIHWYLVDLPGYGYAKRSQEQRKTWNKMIEDYIRKRENLLNLFVLIDSRHDPQKIDIEFIGKLGEWGIPFALVFTKSDKNKPMATQRNVNAFMEVLRKQWEAPPVFFISSAITREGQEEILDYIYEINERNRDIGKR